MKSKQRSGRIETDCYENSQKRIAYRNYSLIPGRGRLCAKVQKEASFFQTANSLTSEKTVCGWRTQTSSLYADSLNARSLYKCVKKQVNGIFIRFPAPCRHSYIPVPTPARSRSSCTRPCHQVHSKAACRCSDTRPMSCG